MNLDIRAFRKNFDKRTWLIQEEPRGPSQLIEIPVNTNALSQVPQFPTIPNLQSDTKTNIITKAIRIIPDTVLTFGPTTGAPVATLAELQKLSFSIYCEGWLKAQNIPLLTMVDTFTEASGIPWHQRTMQFNNWERIIWEKCVLQYSNGTVSAGAPYVIVMEVEYLKLNEMWEEIIGPN